MPHTLEEGLRNDGVDFVVLDQKNGKPAEFRMSAWQGRALVDRLLASPGEKRAVNQSRLPSPVRLSAPISPPHGADQIVCRWPSPGRFHGACRNVTLALEKGLEEMLAVGL